MQKRSARSVCGQIQAVCCVGHPETALHAGLGSFIIEVNWDPLRGSKQDDHRCSGAFGGLRRMWSWKVREGC